MKRIIFVIVVLFGFCYCSAQHLSFMGIQLGQPERTFDRMLRQKGFQYVGTNNVMLTKMYQGTFWKFKNTTINTEVENGRVTSVLVGPSEHIYNKMSDFNNLVRNLDAKYRKHYQISSFFKNSFLADRDGYFWKAPGGYIVAYYSRYSGSSNIMISIEYMDRTNKIVVLENGRNRNTDDDL